MNDQTAIIIPVYNEPQAPEGLVAKLREQVGDGPDILIVDDGSDTPVGEIEGARIIRLSKNRGYGAAVRVGIRATHGDHIVIIDADGTYPVEVVPRLLELLQDHEMVVGARTGANVQMPFLNRVVKGTLTRVAAFLAEERIPDINSGLRAFRRESAEPYLKLLPNRFSLTTTLTLAFLCNHHSVHFEPIDYHPRVGKSHWRPIVDTREFILTILRTVFFFNPMRVCFPLAMGLWAGALIVLWIGLSTPARIMDGTISVLALGGLLILLVGLLADVIRLRD